MAGYSTRVDEAAIVKKRFKLFLITFLVCAVLHLVFAEMLWRFRGLFAELKLEQTLYFDLVEHLRGGLGTVIFVVLGAVSAIPVLQKAEGRRPSLCYGVGALLMILSLGMPASNGCLIHRLHRQAESSPADDGVRDELR